MAKMERYIFNVDAQTDRAIKKLSEVQRLMDNIENVRNKGVGDYSTINQKDMDKAMRSMAELTRKYKEAADMLKITENRAREAADRIKIPKDGNPNRAKRLREEKLEQERLFRAAKGQQRLLRSEYNAMLKDYRKLSQFQQNSSKNFKPAMASNDIFNLPQGKRARSVIESIANEVDGVTNKVKGVKETIQEVNKLDRRAESMSRRAVASKYMSYQQARSFRDDAATVRADYPHQREVNLNEMTKLGQERSKLSKQVEEIQRKAEPTEKDIDRKVAMQHTIETIDKEMEARMELNRVLNRTIRNMDKFNNEVLEANVEVKPERGTFQGMIYERAPAIGLALGGAVAGVVGSLYHQGAQLNRSMRGDIVSMGQRTGMAGADWREGIRDTAMNAGLQGKLGFTGQEMLAFQNNYLSNAGFRGMDDLNTAMQQQAIFSRTTGMDSETTKQFFDSVFSTGAVNGSQAKDIQNAFIGAIKQSGLEGKEEDQLKALEGLLGVVSSGRTLTNDQVMNVMGLQSILSSEGSKSLRGEQGGQLLQDLNSGLRQGFNNPMVRLAFGQGTEYQGLEGRFALRQKMDEGISNIDNINNIGRIAQSFSNSEQGQNEVFASFVEEGLGVDITAEQAKGLMDLFREGKLSEENIGKVLETDKSTGEQTAQERLEQYRASHESTDAQSDAVTEKQATQLYDLGESIREANTALGGLPAAVYASILALGAFTVAALGSAGAFKGSEWIRGLAGGRFGGRRDHSNPNRPKPMDTVRDLVGGWFDPNRRNGGLPNKGNPTKGKGRGVDTESAAGKSSLWDKVKSFFGGDDDGGGGGKGSGKSSGFMSHAPGGGGALGKILSKAALPLGVISAAGAILTAPAANIGETVGNALGGLGGGVGGGAAGAALGSMIFPGVGTIVGGLLGSLGGSSLGGAIGGWLGSKADGNTAEAASPDDTNPNEIDKQVERENTNRKDQAENKRTDNIAAERENLHLFETLLNRVDQILHQARSQNGIIGNSNMAGSGGMFGSGEGAPTLAGNGNAEKIWNFFSEKGFNSTAISAVMGNLQQESGLDPTAVNPSSGAFGIGQWLGGRKTNLQNFAKDRGMDYKSLEAQLEFLWHELNGGDSTTVSKLNKSGGLNAFAKSSNLKSATELFERAFERSGGDAMGKRVGYANDFYKQFGSAQWKTSASSAATKSAANSNTAKIESTINVNVKGDEKVSDKVSDSRDMAKTANKIQNLVYGSMNFFSQETKRV